MTNDTEILLKIKKVIDESKIKIAQEEGKMNAAKERLKTEFDLDSIEEAEKYIEKLGNKINKKEEQLAEGIHEIKQEFNL